MATMLAKQDPRLTDAIWSEAGQAMRECAPPKKWARALGKSERLMQMRCSGEKPGGFAMAGEELTAAQMAGIEIGPLLTFLRVRRQVAMTHMDEGELREWVRERMLKETEAQGPLDNLQMRYNPDRMTDAEMLDYLADLEDAAKAQASLCDDLAVGAKLMRQAVERRTARRVRRAS